MNFKIFNGENYIRNSKRLERGEKNCKELSICFVGIVRNVGKFLEYNLQRVEGLEKYFKNVKYFLYENDSTDNTVSILERWTVRKNNFFYNTENICEELPVNFGAHSYKRFVKMARLRNKYVKWLRSLNDKPDYVVVMDWDLKGGIDTNGFILSFSRLDWDVMAANGIDCKDKHNIFIKKERIYDPLAFEDSDGRRVKGHSVRNYSNYCEIPVMNPFIPKRIPVKSSFAGMVLYKSDIFDTTDYGPYHPIDCEHIMLHRQLTNKRMYINSELLLIR
jgi:hypothetical protein